MGGPLDAVVAHLADEVEQVLRGERRRPHHQLVQDASEGPLRYGGSIFIGSESRVKSWAK